MDAIAEHSPQAAPANANGADKNAADSDGDSTTRDTRSSAERPAEVSYTEDSNPEPVVNGLS